MDVHLRMYLNIVGHERPEVFAAPPVLEFEIEQWASTVVPSVEVKNDPRYVYGDELVAGRRGGIGLRPLGHRVDDIAPEAHTDSIEGGHVDPVLRAAP